MAVTVKGLQGNHKQSMVVDDNNHEIFIDKKTEQHGINEKDYLYKKMKYC